MFKNSEHEKPIHTASPADTSGKTCSAKLRVGLLINNNFTESRDDTKLDYKTTSMNLKHLLVVGLAAWVISRDALQSAVLRLHVVCLSVCLSVTLVDQDHIGWKSWKLIARTITLNIFALRSPKAIHLLTSSVVE